MKELKEAIKSLQFYLYRMDLGSLEIEWQMGNLEDIVGFDPVAKGLTPVEFAQGHYHPDDRHLMAERIQQFREDKLTCWTGIYRIKHQLGQWVWVYSRLHVMHENRYAPHKKIAGLMMEATSGMHTEDQFSAMLQEAMKIKHEEKIKGLTLREISVLKLIAEGKSYTEIAAELNIHPETVNSHRKNILNKLKIHNIAQLICFAKETGLI